MSDARRLLHHRAVVHRPHRAELEDAERLLIEAVALLPENDGPRTVEPDQQRHDREQGRKQKERQRGDRYVEGAFLDLLEAPERPMRDGKAADRSDLRDLDVLQRLQRSCEAQMHRNRQLHQRHEAGLDEIGARPRQRDEDVVGAVQADGRDGQLEILQEERLRLAQRETADELGAVLADARGNFELLDRLFEPDHRDPPARGEAARDAAPHSPPGDGAARQDEARQSDDIEQRQAQARIVADRAGGDAERERRQRRQVPQRKGARELAGWVGVAGGRVTAVVQFRQHDEHGDDEPDVEARAQPVHHAAEQGERKERRRHRRGYNRDGVGERGDVAEAEVSQAASSGAVRGRLETCCRNMGDGLRARRRM